MKKPVFEETQHFGRSGLWFAMVTMFLIVVYSFFQMTVIGLNWIILAALIPGILFFLVLVLFFRRMKLHVRADQHALEFRFSPLQREYQVIEWQFIEHVEIVETSPIRRVAGWGIRYGPTRAFSIGGNEGVEITLPNGLKVFLGSAHANELERVIRKHRNKIKKNK